MHFDREGEKSLPQSLPEVAIEVGLLFDTIAKDYKGLRT
jgi:hypothetical protein